MKRSAIIMGLALTALACGRASNQDRSVSPESHKPLVTEGTQPSPNDPPHKMIPCEAQHFTARTLDSHMEVTVPDGRFLSLSFSIENDVTNLLVNDAASSCIDGVHKYAFWGRFPIKLHSKFAEDGATAEHFVKLPSNQSIKVGKGTFDPTFCEAADLPCKLELIKDGQTLRLAISDQVNHDLLLAEDFKLAEQPQYLPLFAID